MIHAARGGGIIRPTLLHKICMPEDSVKSGKAKFSLCLTKHQAMKMHWGIGGIAPYVLSLGTR
jgi:hypothetical protein